MIKLVEDTIDGNDLINLVEWISNNPRLTKGPVTVELEKKFAEYIGTKYAVFVNSGSSANLLMLYALMEAGKLKIGDKVAVPALSWATDLAPVIQLGLEPVLIDCNMDNLSIDINHFLHMIKEEDIKVLLLVSVLGLVPNMNLISSLCHSNGITLLEDACESMGSKFGDKKLGSFGLMSSFSTYFGHHISTIEGGFICTNNNAIKNILLTLRSHGWDRDVDECVSKNLRDRWKVSEFNSFYTFYTPGFNMRSTDLQAFIGVGQIDKLPEICELRNRNFKAYQSLLKTEWKPERIEDNFVSNFAYPILHEKRDEIVKRLQEKHIEVRPLICGSHGTQPMYVKRYGKKILPNVDVVDKHGMYLPNHPKLTAKQIQYICDIINEVIA